MRRVCNKRFNLWKIVCGHQNPARLLPTHILQDGESILTWAETSFLKAVLTKLRSALYVHWKKPSGFGERDPHVASSCNNLAELYRMRREYAKAEPLFLESVQRLEQALGPLHESVGFALHNLAGTYLQQHKYEEARICSELLIHRSLKLKEQKLGSSHPEYANTMFHLAEVIRLQGKTSDAEYLIRDSLRILELDFRRAGHSQQALRRMSRLAELLVHSGKLHEAENLQRKILHILELSQGPESLSTITAADNLATTLQALRKLDEAEELFLRCLRVRQKALSSTHIQVGSTLFKLGVVTTQQADNMVLDKSGTLEQAKTAYGMAEGMLRQRLGMEFSHGIVPF